MFKSILNNFSVLLELGHESVQVVKNTEMKARILGVSAQMKKFKFFFGVLLGPLILGHTDNLNMTVLREDTVYSTCQNKLPVPFTYDDRQMAVPQVTNATGSVISTLL